MNAPPAGTTLEHLDLELTGMTCAACANRIEKKLNRLDGVTATDGLDAWSGPIGQFPAGVIAFHDDQDKPDPGQQNYKMVDWRDIRQALDLD